MTYRILSLDGGGSRALIPVSILQRLLDKQPNFLNHVNLIAGTSTSGITALILASADTPEQGLEIARDLWIQGKKLFAESSKVPATADFEFNAKNAIDSIKSIKSIESIKSITSARELWNMGKKALTMNKLRGMTALTGACAYFSQDDLEATLHEIFEDKTIADLKHKILIPAINLGTEEDEHWAPSIIHNLDNRFNSLSLVEVALRVAAMPILFPSHSEHIDAALLTNNPALTAVAQILEDNAATMDEMRILSIGTGENPITLHGSDPDLGYAGWMMDPKLPLAMMQAIIETNSQLTDYQCKQIFTGLRYHRLNPKLGRPWLMHEHKAQFIIEAADIAEDTPLDSTADWLNQVGWNDAQPATHAKRRRSGS
jgi:patatin-like phospholipase/acyl hydrolase